MPAPISTHSEVVTHLRKLRCDGCGKIIFEHERRIEAVIAALGIVRHICGCNYVTTLPRRMLDEGRIS
jgi:hypothetical protein